MTHVEAKYHIRKNEIHVLIFKDILNPAKVTSEQKMARKNSQKKIVLHLHTILGGLVINKNQIVIHIWKALISNHEEHYSKLEKLFWGII